MNNTQLQNIVAPLVAALAGFLAGKGYIFDSATWSTILMGISGVLVAIWTGWTTRNQALVNQTAALPEVKTIITTPSVATAGPSNVVATTKEAQTFMPGGSKDEEKT